METEQSIAVKIDSNWKIWSLQRLIIPTLNMLLNSQPKTTIKQWELFPRGEPEKIEYWTTLQISLVRTTSITKQWISISTKRRTKLLQAPTGTLLPQVKPQTIRAQWTRTKWDKKNLVPRSLNRRITPLTCHWARKLSTLKWRRENRLPNSITLNSIKLCLNNHLKTSSQNKLTTKCPKNRISWNLRLIIMVTSQCPNRSTPPPTTGLNKENPPTTWPPLKLFWKLQQCSWRMSHLKPSNYLWPLSFRMDQHRRIEPTLPRLSFLTSTCRVFPATWMQSL